MKQKNMGFYQRIFIITMFLLGILVLFVGFIAQSMFRGYTLESKKSDLFHQAEILSQTFDNDALTEAKQTKILQESIDNIAQNNGTRITVVNLQGSVVADSHYDAAKMENHMNRVEISSALNGFNGISKKFSATLGQEFLYVAVPIRVKGDQRIIGAIRASVPYDGVDALFNKFSRLLMLATTGILVLTGGIFYLLSYRMTKNLREMCILAEEIADGNFDRELQLNSRDEIGSLAKAFNRMAAKVKVQISEISTERGKFMAVLNGISDCVIAVDASGKLIVFNPAAAFLFKDLSSLDIDRPLLEAVRNNDIYESLKIVLETNSCMCKEVNIINNTTYALTGSPILGEKGETIGAVAILRDISEAKALETIKSQFVANVSHELKTPLTSIKGFVETLLDETPDNYPIQRHFLEIIAEETDNLSDMVNDLLNLSELESGKIPMRYTKINLYELVQRCSFLLESVLDKNNITFCNLVAKDFPLVDGDAYRLQQLLRNLLDNAAKYAPNGIVEVSATRLGSEIVEITVADNGKGIPEKDQARLFERFYRVDKDRARQSGGTGLGLAIVKHIAMAHGGRVMLDSVEGFGTKVIIHLPYRRNDKEN